jgi:hypothetical protein
MELFQEKHDADGQRSAQQLYGQELELFNQAFSFLFYLNYVL